MKILLGIPSYGAPSKPFLESLAALELPAGTTAFNHVTVTGNFVPAQRELIVERAIASSADILVMCDDDMVLPKDALVQLSAVFDAQPRCALAGALYYSRDGFRPMAVDDWDPSDTTTATIPAFDDAPVRVAGVGFGCIAIRMAAVLELEPPYFESHVYVEPAAGRVRVCNEDYLFCHRLRAAGWEIALHAGLRCGHYDRERNAVMPHQWEPRERTAIKRMAVVRDGRPALVPFAPAPAHGEHHRAVRVDYVSPKDEATEGR